jgi:hypothetical protein
MIKENTGSHAFDIPNNVGICSIYYIDKNNITAFPSRSALLAKNNASTPATADIAFADITYTPATAFELINEEWNFDYGFDEIEKEDTSGKYYEYELPLFLPNDDYASRAKLLRSMEHRSYLLFIKNKNNQWRIIGSKERGASFSRDFYSGSLASSTISRYAGKFTWKSKYPAYYVADVVF